MNYRNLEKNTFNLYIGMVDMKHMHTTGGWWNLNWGGQARGNGWSGIVEMASNTLDTWLPFIMSRSSLSSLLAEAPAHLS